MPMLERDSKEIEKQIISQLKLKREEVKVLEEELREIQIIISKISAERSAENLIITIYLVFLR